MKRLLLKLSGLSLVIVLGLIAMAWGQRGSDKGAATREPAKLPTTTTGAVPKPIPLASSDEDAAVGSNPFNRARAASAAGTSARRTSAPRAVDEDEVASDDARVEPRGNGSAGRRDPFGLRVADRGASTDEAEVQTAAADVATDEAATDVDSSATTASSRAAKLAPRRLPNLQARSTQESAAHASVEEPARPAERPARRPLPAVAPRATESASDRAVGEAAAQDAGAESPSGVEGTGRPGEQQLEGPQVPSLTIEKVAPGEIQIGKPATFTIKVRNTGSAVAHGVEVRDTVPRGTQLVAASPRAAQGRQGELLWDLGSIKPGEQATVQVQLMPTAEGEVGSTASVHFRAEASARTLATRPSLDVKVSGPGKVLIGQNVDLKIQVSNPGSGATTGVIVTEQVPAGLKHAAGSELEFEIGVLKPGESRELTLTLAAASPGSVKNVLQVRADANLSAEAETGLEVVAPDLKVAMTGPKKRYLERAATYNISVSNPGTAPAHDIELVTVLPRGLKFVEATNSGQYDAATHSVYWSLDELPAQETGNVTLRALPIEPGDLKVKIKGQARQGLVDQKEETIVVEGLAAVQFEIADANDPVEVGGETTYEVRVTNQGSKAATNVKVAAVLPPDMKLLSADGPVRHSADGQTVNFDALNQLAPKADTTFTIKVQATKVGDQRIRVQVTSDDMRSPITKEESTRVYGDEE